ncbi:TPA: prolipoprotein diacylglyceryl transferase [Candidatus Gracilibacteria bacterium]|nr:hypothetical protein [Candidatus Peregrinibacteria bacterium]HIQ56667.1 prolipoprotein diacylglyceryl transferase [Candidatus Gracilibacteria bacterium]HIQ57495.1 prolipoprotein diacylglyceryl transferase [Candidatus Gracilibacteria bacterium]
MQNFLLSFGIFEITVSLILTIFGFSLSFLMLTRTVHERKLSLLFLSDNIILLTLFSMFFGRLGIFLTDLAFVVSEKVFEVSHWYEKFWVKIEVFFAFWQGGINLIWALAGFLFVFLILCFIKNEKPLSWLDAFSLPFVWFLIFYSLGEFFSGENYGKPAPDGFPLTASYNLRDVQYQGEVFPVQVYEAVLLLVLFFFAYSLWEKYIDESWPNGIVGGVVLSALFFVLFLLEFLRWGATPDVLGFIPIEGFLLLMVSFGILLFMFFRGHFWFFSRFKSRFGNV